jgi:choline/glycine/proline betaine transport protein
MLGFTLMAIGFGESSKKIFDNVQSTIVEDFSWVFTLSTMLFLIFIFFLLFSRFGRLRLGQPNDKPEFGFRVN